MASRRKISSSNAYSQSSPSFKSNAQLRSTPMKPLLIGYCHNAQTDKIEKAIQNGVNVIIWSFIHMEIDPKTHEPIITTDLQMDKIQQIQMQHQNKQLIHMAAFGGWNGPHPPSGISGKKWCQAFAKFNEQYNNIFSGIDWDLEGHDDREAPTSRFTMEVLDVMVDFSLEAKERYGLLVSLAPAESYLDPLLDAEVEGNQLGDEYDTKSFSLNLNLFPPVWNNRAEDRKFIEDMGFSHAGLQCYAYVLHKAGIHTFDWISFQYYESYSRFVYDTTQRNPVLKQEDALLIRAKVLDEGFYVDLPTLGKIEIRVPLEKIVFGFANGWADGIKSVKVDVRAVKKIFKKTLGEQKERSLGGIMFWTIEEEGTNDVFLSKSFKNVLESNQKHFESNEL